jgi:hypothetical protein
MSIFERLKESLLNTQPQTEPEPAIFDKLKGRLLQVQPSPESIERVFVPPEIRLRPPEEAHKEAEIKMPVLEETASKIYVEPPEEPQKTQPPHIDKAPPTLDLFSPGIDFLVTQLGLKDYISPKKIKEAGEKLSEFSTGFLEGLADEMTLGMTKKPYKYEPRTPIEALGNVIGRFTGFFGTPMMYGGSLGSMAVKGGVRALEKAGMPVFAQMLRESVPLGFASLFSDLSKEGIEHAPQRALHAFLFGAVLGGNKFIDFNKTPLLSKFIRQFSSRALLNLLNQYDPQTIRKIANDIARGKITPETSQAFFDELLLTVFSSHKLPDYIRNKPLREIFRQLDNEVAELRKAGAALKELKHWRALKHYLVTPENIRVPYEWLRQAEDINKLPDLMEQWKELGEKHEYKKRHRTWQEYSSSDPLMSFIKFQYGRIRPNSIYSYKELKKIFPEDMLVRPEEAKKNPYIGVTMDELASELATGVRERNQTFISMLGDIVTKIPDSGYSSDVFEFLAKRASRFRRGLPPDSYTPHELRRMERERARDEEITLLEDELGEAFDKASGYYLDFNDKVILNIAKKVSTGRLLNREKIIEKLQKRAEEAGFRKTEETDLQPLDVALENIKRRKEKFSKLLSEEEKPPVKTEVSPEFKEELETIKRLAEKEFAGERETLEDFLERHGIEIAREEKPTREKTVEEMLKELEEAEPVMMEGLTVGLVRPGEGERAIQLLKEKYPDAILGVGQPGKVSKELIETAEKLVERVSTEDIIKSLANRYYEETEPKEPIIGLGIQKLKRALKGEEKTGEIKLSDRFEKVFQTYRKVPHEGILTQMKKAVSKIFSGFRAYPTMPNKAEYIVPKEAFRQIKAYRGVVPQEAYEAINGIIAGLSDAEISNFRKYVWLADLYQTARINKDLKLLDYGFTREEVEREYKEFFNKIKSQKKVLEAVRRRAELYRAIQRDFINLGRSLGADFSHIFNRPDYFRHLVIDYVIEENIKGKGTGRLKVPRGRSYMRQRKGGYTKGELEDLQKLGLEPKHHAYITEYAVAEHDVLTRLLMDLKVLRELNRIAHEYDDLLANIKQKAKEMGVKNWHFLIPKDFKLYQFDPGKYLYSGKVITDRIVEQVLRDPTLVGKEETVERIIDKARDALIIGQDKPYFLIREGTERALNQFFKRSDDTLIKEVWRKFHTNVKRWFLLSPRYVTKYNIRNFTGDAQAVFIGNPRAFKYLPKSIKDLYEAFVRKTGMSPELREFFRLGGVRSSFHIQELGDLGRLYEQITQGSIAKNESAFKKIVGGYFKKMGAVSEVREALLRYANYLSIKDEIIRNGGKPKSYYASIKGEIDALPSIEEKAYRLANELLGNYEELSTIGEALRGSIFPFWSWQEVNTRRYYRLYRNAIAEAKIIPALARTIAGTAMFKAPYYTYLLGRIALKGYLLYAIYNVLNNIFYGEAEQSLSEEQRARTHLFLPPFIQKELRKAFNIPEGKVIYFNRLGSLDDLMSWFALDSLPIFIHRYKTGEMSLKEILKEMAEAPIDKAYQLLHPAMKIPLELATGMSIFPEFDEPRLIKDKTLYLARSVGLEELYRALKKDVPDKPIGETILNYLFYVADGDASAYYDIFDKETMFLKKLGKDYTGGIITNKTPILYHMAQSLRFGDKESFKILLSQYIEEVINSSLLKTEKEVRDSIKKGITQSIKNLAPLSRLNKREKAVFLATLSSEDWEKLERANRHYQELVETLLEWVNELKKEGE